MTPDLDDILRSRRVVVCVGSGGVGKTSLSAAIGMHAAIAGARVLVLTIDPARRLATSLGLSTLGNTQQRIDLTGLEVGARGELWAMTLDLRGTWDAVVARNAPTPERRDAILRNRLYKELSTKLAGSLEYMAMEKVHELDASGEFDLVVLDTPPTAHALDFIDAPNRLVDLFGNDAVRLLLSPTITAGKVGLSLVHLGSSYVLRGLARFTGAELLSDVAEFLRAFQGMYEGFKDRAAAVKALLASDRTAFVLVCGPSPSSVDEAGYFASELERAKIKVRAAIVNRLHGDPAALAGALAPEEIAIALAHARLPNEGEPRLSDRLSAIIDENRLWASRDLREAGRLRTRLGGAVPFFTVPALDTDIHDVPSLWELGHRLAPTGP